jgi:hypothetical protein
LKIFANKMGETNSTSSGGYKAYEIAGMEPYISLSLRQTNKAPSWAFLFELHIGYSLVTRLQEHHS